MNTLRQYCSDRSLAEIAKELSDCDRMWCYMGINEARHQEIYKDTLGSYSNYKHQLLLAWRKHHGAKATYQKLCDMFNDYGDQKIIVVVEKLALYGEYFLNNVISSIAS